MNVKTWDEIKNIIDVICVNKVITDHLDKFNALQDIPC